MELMWVVSLAKFGGFPDLFPVHHAYVHQISSLSLVSSLIVVPEDRVYLEIIF
jgi:hypothetical protein